MLPADSISTDYFFYLLVSFVGSLITLAAMLNVILQGPKRRGNQLMALLLMSVALIISQAIVRRLSYVLPITPRAIMGAGMFSFEVSGIAIIAFAMHSVGRWHDRWVRPFYFGSLLYALITTFVFLPQGAFLYNIAMLDNGVILFDLTTGGALNLIVIGGITIFAFYTVLKYWQQLPRRFSSGALMVLSVFVIGTVFPSSTENIASLFPIIIASVLFAYVIIVENFLNPLSELHAKLQLSEQRYRGITHLAFDFAYVFEIDKDQIKLIWWTDTFRNYIEIPFNTWVPFEDMAHTVHGADQAIYQVAFAKLLQGETITIEFRLITSDNREVWTRTYAQPIWNPAEGRVTQFFGATLDISQEKNLLLDLQTQEQKFRAVFNQAFQFSALLTPYGEITEINQASLAFFGLERAQDVVGQHLWELPFFSASDGIIDLIQNLVGGTAEGEIFRKELTIVNAAGETKLLDCSIKPIYSGQKRLGMLLFEARDITAQKKTLEVLMHTQKLESLGLLAGGIAHDFNNLLTSMLAQSSLAMRKMNGEHPSRVHLEKAMQSSYKAADLTRQMLAYAGKGQFEIHAINLNHLIEENLSLLESSIPKNVRLGLALNPDILPIEADPSQLQQVVMNLIINGAEAIEDQNGEVLVETDITTIHTHAQGERYFSRSPLAPGYYTVLRVRDTGMGIAPELHGQIFDPFFSTKPEGRGLGLAALLGVVQAHAGGIAIESQVGEGAIFEVLFPASETAVATYRSPVLEDGLSLSRINGRSPTRVLVVDDEEAVRDVATDVLEMTGMTVITAENGQEAVDIYREQHQEIDVILLDMQMPVMNGARAYHHLKEINPNAKIIISSGYDQSESINGIVGLGSATFLRKPYNAQKLVDMVEKRLLAEAEHPV